MAAELGRLGTAAEYATAHPQQPATSGGAP